jgi:spermidine synthase
MAFLFEEIDSQPSPLGEISLRRKRTPMFGDRDLYEVKLGDEFLMSSMFVEAEVALADLGLAATAGNNLNVVVGGLGLGYTADAALRCDRVGELLVVEALDTVIQWHQQEKVPLGKILNNDSRCRYINANFFDLAVSAGKGFDPNQPNRLFDAILLDIDHSPTDLLNDANAVFYNATSLAAMAKQLHSDGVFALWSNDAEEGVEFSAELRRVFTSVACHQVSFYNPLQNKDSANTVYVAQGHHGHPPTP